MPRFLVAEERCAGCGRCVKDCPAHLLVMADGHPAVDDSRGVACYDCQHCLAVCPSAAITLGDARPQDCVSLTDFDPRPETLETLIRGRRSVRQYETDDVDPATIDHLLEVASYAPTGVNARSVHFTLIDTRVRLDRLRTDSIAAIRELLHNDRLPPTAMVFADIVKAWDAAGIDIIFRGAPHLVIATTPKSAPSGPADGMIALSTLDLFAQANGLGTVWAGFVVWLLGLAPELGNALGIPPDHDIVHGLLFGRPAVRYARTVQRGKPPVRRVA